MEILREIFRKPTEEEVHQATVERYGPLVGELMYSLGDRLYPLLKEEAYDAHKQLAESIVQTLETGTHTDKVKAIRALLDFTTDIADTSSAN